jgi:hypothetical protein
MGITTPIMALGSPYQKIVNAVELPSGGNCT